MRRRDLLLAAVSYAAAPGQPRPKGSEKPKEWVTAAASRDTAPRVGLIPSTFTGGEEMDGRKIRALAMPAPLDAPLSAAQWDDMLRLAVELGGGRRGGLVTAVRPDDWVVIKTCVRGVPPGAAGWSPAMVTDPRLVSSLLRYLTERKLGRRFSIVAGPPYRGPWDLPWNSNFDGAGYRAIIDALAKAHPALRFELIDLNTAPSLEMPVEGRFFASRNSRGVYHVPRVLRECDKVISIAPLATAPDVGASLTILNYLGFGPGEQYGYPKRRLLELGRAGEVALDLFSFHPADYAIAGGPFAGEAGAGTRRHNVLVAGTNAPAVDAVGAAVMGLDSAATPYLDLAVQRGYGVADSYSIWTRGVEIDEVKSSFRVAAA
ncbi:MAG: DUF362 domain-containing protein [Bryobacteraceae bacterium]